MFKNFSSNFVPKNLVDSYNDCYLKIKEYCLNNNTKVIEKQDIKGFFSNKYYLKLDSGKEVWLVEVDKIQFDKVNIDDLTIIHIK
jgi:hypothetical protein